MKSIFSHFIRDETGATAIEYGLIAAMVSVAIIAAITTMGDNLTSTFSSIAIALGTASST